VILAVLRLPAFIPAIEGALEGHVRANVEYLRRFPRTPALYRSGVRYRFIRPGADWWLIPDVLTQRWGDCKDLSAWRVAELRVHLGELARVRVERTAKDTYHAIVERGDGRIEDPSRALGMKDSTHGRALRRRRGPAPLGACCVAR
jgi:hypothetical protein